MHNVSRINKDIAAGNGGLLISGANTVFTNNEKTVREGSLTAGGATVIQGATTVFVENKPIGRMGDLTSDGGAILTGSTTVFARDIGPADVVIVENDDIEDGTPATKGAGARFLAREINNKVLDPNIIKRATTSSPIISDDTRAKAPPKAIQACGQIHSMRSFPLDLKISKYFTLENMLRKWITGQRLDFPTHNLRVNKGFSVDQIVCNLSLLCQNILDPLWDRDKDWIITNSFREGDSQAQHGNGQACDLKFVIYNRPKLYERAQWIRDNLPFDQLLLEYRDNSGRISNWIHVSFTGSGISRLRNGATPVGPLPISASNKIGTLYNNIWKSSTLQLY